MIQKGAAAKRLKNFIIYYGVMGTGKSSAAHASALATYCEDLKNGNPCLRCESCLSIKRALETTGVSRRVVVKNIPALGRDNTGKSMTELIREIFVLLQDGVEVNTYILGEVHAMKLSDQRTLLEEIDRMGDNTRIIMTTTELNQLLPELVSRANAYPFFKISYGESRMLLDRTTQRLGIKLDAYTTNLLIRYADGIPRDLVRLIEFVKDNEPTIEQIHSFLGVIGNGVFMNLIGSLFGDMRGFVLAIDGLLRKFTIDKIVSQLQNFLVQAAFWLEDSESGELTKEEGTYLKGMISEDNFYKLSLMLERADTRNIGEAEFKLLMLRARNMLTSKPTNTAFKENNKLAAGQKIHQADMYKEEVAVTRSVERSNSGVVDSDFFKQLREGNNSNEGKN